MVSTTDAIIMLFTTGCVLSAFSWLYKENKWFTFTEYILIGAMAGFKGAQGIVVFYNSTFRAISPEHFVGPVLGFIAGLLMFATFIPKLGWLTKYSLSIMIGTGIGVNLRSAAQTQLGFQIAATIFAFDSPSMLVNISNLILLAATVSVLVVFLFTPETKGIVKHTSFIGRCFLMVAFGVTYGFKVMGGTSSLILRWRDILVWPSYLMLIPAVLLIAYDVMKSRNNGT